MKISVIVPVYNVAAYLQDCINSVMNQTYEYFELVLINDGSTDGSGDICDQNRLQYPEKVIVIHTSNLGPMNARIQGIKKATGDILVFLDGDDCIRNDALRTIAKCFSTKECDMILYNAAVCSEFPSTEISYPFLDGQIFEANSKKILYQKLIYGQISNSVCLKAIKRTCANLPEYFTEFYHVKHGEDLLMSAYFITNCDRIAYLDQGLYHYRIRPGSTVHSFDLQRAESIKTVHTELEKCIALWGMAELKPAHNARKVRGWIDSLLLLLRNKDNIPKSKFQRHLNSLAEDPYFLSAYSEMDQTILSRPYRIMAYCLIKRQYSLLALIMFAKQSLQKIKTIFRRKYGG